MVRAWPGRCSLPPGLTPAGCVPITTAELDPPRPAPRPANSVLDNAALRLSELPLLPIITTWSASEDADDRREELLVRR